MSIIARPSVQSPEPSNFSRFAQRRPRPARNHWHGRCRMTARGRSATIGTMHVDAWFAKAAASAVSFRAADELHLGFALLHQAAIDREIVEGHPPRGEALLELLPDRVPVQPG